MSRPASPTDESWRLTIPDDNTRRQELSREEQVVLAGRLRKSVILDAADEAIYKASRRATRNSSTPIMHSPAATSTGKCMEYTKSKRTSTSEMEHSLYESFRWMDEEKDLDLRLVLDDYHANLDGAVLPSPSSLRRPSFRRRMSISKTPFGRESLSSINQNVSVNPLAPAHKRQRSRAMSLISPKHVAADSLTSIDPHATHYRDPEARLKLRVYLASPQKFDEAIEFGFPSTDGVTSSPDKENRYPYKSFDRTSSLDKGATFLSDENVSLFEDDISMLDPDSPRTPLETDVSYQCHSGSPYTSKVSKASADFSHLGITRPTLHKQTDSYSQAIAGSREMTLRMTLTRPDLRADESLLYGWQNSRSPLREEPFSLDGSSISDEKIDVRGPFGGSDGWGPAEKDNGVVKRMWRKVKSSQKKNF